MSPEALTASCLVNLCPADAPWKTFWSLDISLSLMTLSWKFLELKRMPPEVAERAAGPWATI